MQLIETISKIVHATRRKLRETGREPTLEELAAELAMPPDEVRDALDIAKTPIMIALPPGRD